MTFLGVVVFRDNQNTVFFPTLRGSPPMTLMMAEEAPAS
jgi:hypothetical protein